VAPRRRLRWWLKWIGTFLCWVLVVAWVCSLRWWFGYSCGTQDPTIFVAHGTAGFDDPSVVFQRGWYAIKTPRGVEVVWRPRSDLRSYAIVPLWCPFVLIAGITAFLWWRDRRLPPGHCRKCGYNLTGNVSGVCPECGEPVPQR
jgi:hypothetical protein